MKPALRLLVTVLAAGWAAAGATAPADVRSTGAPPLPCDGPGVAIFDRALPGGGVRLVARCRTSIPTTVRLPVTLTNLVADRPLPVIVTLPGIGEYPLVDLRFKQPGAAWHADWSTVAWISGRLDARQDPAAVYDLPWEPGKSHRVLQGPHNSASWYAGGCAIDFDLAEGTPVCAARDGVVVGFQDECGKAGGPGTPSNFVVVLQADGTLGDYEHLARGGVLVGVGQRVRTGDRLGFSDNTGASTGPHLHFGVLSVTRDLAWAPQRLRFRVTESAEPVEMAVGRTYTRPGR